MFSWQPIAVAAVLLLAVAYVSRRVWARLSSLKPSIPLKSSCRNEACSGCGPVLAPKVRQ